MTQLQVKAAMVALVAASLGACATPEYAARANYTPPSPVQPQYPVRPQPAPAAPVPAAAPAPPQAEDASAPPAAAPTSAIESQALPPPAAAAPARVAQAEPAPQPDTSSQPEPAPPPPAPPEHIVPPSSEAPPQRAEPPRLRRTVTQPPHMAVAGRVVGDTGVFFDYQVSKGDHVDALGREYGTTRKVIVETNHLKPPYGLRPGQILKLPVAKAYVVQSGDTLAQVGKRFSVSVGELAELNHISSRTSLRAGQKLGLPPSYSDRGPIRVAGTSVTEYEPAPPPARQAPPPRVAAYTPPPEPYRAPVAAPAYSPPPAPAAPPAAAPPREVATASPPPRAPQPVYAPRPQTPDTAPPLSENEIQSAAHGRFIWPLHGDILSGFGVKGVGRRNDGVDIKAPQGTVVQAAAGGDVVYAGDQVPGFGNLVLVKHADGWVTAYAHLDKVSVQMRQQVAQGQELGQVGLSGGVTEPQLHFEVRYAPTPQDKAKPVDPVLVLPR